RSPRRVVFEFPEAGQEEKMVEINKHLFDWVIENLLRNALDSMRGTGTISCRVSEEKNFVVINISDTGEGIPPSKFKTVFQPGYSTKKRGWGLGLSLAKRIIESYHSGRIFVQNSVLKEGTTFTIKLPKSIRQSEHKE
ncbi:MAG: two-component system, sporulation sensor kinase D, partial [Flavobacteriales bacterium]